MSYSIIRIKKSGPRNQLLPPVLRKRGSTYRMAMPRYRLCRSKVAGAQVWLKIFLIDNMLYKRMIVEEIIISC